MCIAKIYLEKDSTRIILMEEAMLIEKQKDGFLIASMFGEEKFIKGEIKSIDFIKSCVVFIEH